MRKWRPFRFYLNGMILWDPIKERFVEVVNLYADECFRVYRCMVAGCNYSVLINARDLDRMEVIF